MPALLPRLPGMGPAGPPIGGGFEMDVAPPPSPAPGSHEFLRGSGKIGQHRPVFIFDQGSHGHPDPQVFAGFSVLILSPPMLPPGSLELMAVAKIRKGGKLGIGDKNDAPARAPVSAVGTTAGFVGLAAKGSAAVSPV